MTQYELADLAQSAFGNATSAFAVNLSILSGYLIVSYLVGDKLSRTQVVILNSLFVLTAGFIVFLVVGYASSGVRFATLAAPEIASERFFTAKPWTVYAVGGINVIGIVAALYFMYDKRKGRLPAGDE